MRVVNFVIFNPETNKVFVQRRSEKSDLFPNRWEFPGGKLENDETEIECLARRVKRRNQSHSYNNTWKNT